MNGVEILPDSVLPLESPLAVGRADPPLVRQISRAYLSGRSLPWQWKLSRTTGYVIGRGHMPTAGTSVTQSAL